MPWIKVAKTEDINSNGGACVIYDEQQIAIFNYKDGEEWFAIQNMCPHKKAMLLSRGLIGDAQGEPMVACPLHKNRFSLKTGQHLEDNIKYDLKTYPIKVAEGLIYLDL